MMPLRLAMVTIGEREKPIGPVLQAMLSGTLAYSLSGNGRKLWDQMQIRVADLPRLRSFTFDFADHPDFPFEKTMARAEAMTLLNKHTRAFRSVMENELRHCHTDGAGLDRAMVLTVARTRISASEISWRWLGGSLSLPRELKTGNLRQLDEIGRDRDAVERFFCS